jgi:hypothetical protein
MLGVIIVLDEWSSDTPNPPSKSNLLYIRTFELPAALLQDILDKICEDWFGTYDRIHYWQKRIVEELDNDVVYSSRYCGQTTNNPWERHRGDM